MKQKLLFIGGIILFLLTTIIVVFIPIEVVDMNEEQLFFLFFISVIGYLTSFMYFFNWYTNFKQEKNQQL